MGTLGAPAHGSHRLLSLPGAETVVALAGRLMRAAALRSLARNIVRQQMRDFFFPESVPDEEVEGQLALFARRPEILVAMVHVALGGPCELLAETAREIRCPTLFLHGEADAVVPWGHAEAIHRRIVGAGGRSQWELVAGAGHMLIDFQASELAEHVRRFTTSTLVT